MQDPAPTEAYAPPGVGRMEVGMVGLGRMGGNMAKRLMQGGHQVVAFDPNPQAVATSVEAGATGAKSLTDLVSKLSTPRTVWIMVPAGEVTDVTVTTLGHILEKGDTVIDGGNSRYTDSQRHGELLAQRGIDFLDCGTSGGIWGLQEGYCLMIGGEEKPFARCQCLFETLAPANGFLRTGPVGSGHYVKMIHNGIEYGMLEAYAEGFELLAGHEFPLDLAGIADLWQHGSVVRSWLLDLAEDALKKDPRLEGIRGYVEDSGEGRWTVEEAIRLGVPVPALAFSLFERFRSRQQDAWSDRFIAALRNEFGGHAIKRTGQN